MANENKDKQFEKLSFWQLLAKTSVEIPIIQRDYAQGRQNQTKVRDKFLSALYDGLKETVELDFVYGNEEKDTLRPLDGQQRLTTLFLLHWYIATKENKLDENTKMQLSKFTYETRTSSREFCTELVEKGITLENDETISDLIKNGAWFVASWKKDPTISAMLIMLDAIHAKFKEESNLWEKLTNEQRITFLYVKLKDFGLSDDLYIKMNARGKQLTPFENFKAQFEKHIEKNEFEKEIKNPEDKFTHKMDTVWTDLFWKYRGDDGLIDSELVNFFAEVAMNCYAISYVSTEKEKIEDRLRILFNNPNEITHADYPTKEAFDYLVKCLDVYAQNNYAELKSDVDLWKYCGDTLFKDIIQNEKSEWQNRVIFYAQTQYLLKSDYDKNSFNDWIRVVRNIVENSTIDSATTFISAINLIKELSTGSNDIYAFLSENEVKARHAKNQVKEEIEKAKIIIANHDAKQVIHETEDTNFCKGKIDFALYCIDYDNTNISTFAVSELTKIKKVFEYYLSKNDVSNDFRRALFTIQDTLFYNYWWSWLNVVSSDKRCIIEDTNDLKRNFTKKDNWSKYLKDLVLKLCTETIDQIISSFETTQEFSNLPNWKKRIIKEKGLLDHSHSHYISIAGDESRCWLIPYKRVANNSDGKKKLKEIK